MNYGDFEDDNENDYGYYADEFYQEEDEGHFDPYEYMTDVEEDRRLQDEFGAHERAGAPLIQDPWLEKFQNACENEWKEFRLPEEIIMDLKQKGDFIKTLNPLALSVAYWMLYDVSGRYPKLIPKKTQYSINPKTLEKIQQVESKKRISPASLMRYVRFWWDYFGFKPDTKDETVLEEEEEEEGDFGSARELETKTDEPYGDDFDSARFARLDDGRIVNIEDLEMKDEEMDE